MRYLVIGSGGREHTLAWRLMHDGSAREVFVAPGNGGISREYRVDLSQSDHAGIERFCREKKIDAVVVGPEAPLVEGLVDFLDEKKIPAFGPVKGAALLEGSKIFAKTIMGKYNIPTALYREYVGKSSILKGMDLISEFPIVIKLDGLAAGKGVGIPESRREAVEFIEANVREDTRVFVEDYLEGEEASVLGISDGEEILPFVAAQDHKRAFDGDKGPNTGGMGAYAPAPVVDGERLSRVCREILKPTIDGMRQEGIPFRGVLYAGLMIKGDSIKVLEFNVRFGDPEAQVILPLLKGRLGDLLEGSINGTLGEQKISFSGQHAITVVMASGGYPGDYVKGREIRGLDQVKGDVLLFHAGTKEQDGRYYTSGGRVLNVTAMGDSLEKARDLVYNEIGKISIDGGFYRKDIAYRALTTR